MQRDPIRQEIRDPLRENDLDPHLTGEAVQCLREVRGRERNTRSRRIPSVT